MIKAHAGSLSSDLLCETDQYRLLNISPQHRIIKEILNNQTPIIFLNNVLSFQIVNIVTIKKIEFVDIQQYNSVL